MAVRIRMKKMGRKHRPFFRICAIDRRAPRDGRVIEELGYYDPMVKEKDARAVLRAERIDYWLSVGAQPSHKCSVLIKKYGTDGTHIDAQQEALGRLSIKPQAPAAVPIPLPSEEETPAEPPAAKATPAAETATQTATEAKTPAAKPAAAAETETTEAEASDSTTTDADGGEEAKSD